MHVRPDPQAGDDDDGDDDDDVPVSLCAVPSGKPGEAGQCKGPRFLSGALLFYDGLMIANTCALLRLRFTLTW